jgi:hypothetical protein
MILTYKKNPSEGLKIKKIVFIENYNHSEFYFNNEINILAYKI